MTITSDLIKWKESNQLLEIKLVATKKKKTYIGRIIQYDSEKCNILLYLDDEKTTCNINIYEIDHIIPAKRT